MENKGDNARGSLEPPRKNIQLSMKYWLFNRDPYNALAYYNPYIIGL